MFHNTEVVIVVGMGHKTRVIGKDNMLLWHVSEDLKRFKELTIKHPIIMGRKTFESVLKILGKPLPGRTNIVITRNTEYEAEGATVATSLQDALQIATKENPAEIHIGGGAEIYKQALPLVDRIHATYFFDEKEGDAIFPEFENEFEIIQKHSKSECKGLEYQWVDYVRKKPTL